MSNVSVISIPDGPGSITVPPGKWIPNVDQITDSGAGLLAVVLRGFGDFGLLPELCLSAAYFTHGDVVPIPRTEDPGSVLVVRFGSLELGNAGAEQFQFQQGAIGTAVHMVGAFTVELHVPWPMPEGGWAPALAPPPELMEATVLLNQAGWVAFSFLRALSLAGVKVNPPVTPIVQDGIIVGPMKPLGPAGGMAGWSLDVQLQYD